MQYRIAFDPKLGLSAPEFVEAWNTSSSNEDASAEVNENSIESFLSPEISIALITVAVSIPATVIANFVSELLKKKFIEKDSPKVLTTSINTPDGEPLLIIKRSEE